MARHANCRWTNEVIEATAGNLMDGGDRRADALRNAVIFFGDFKYKEDSRIKSIAKHGLQKWV